jgi:LPXTG-motif cell wall-anchored protein
MPLDVKAPVTWPFKLWIDRAGTLTGTVSVQSSQPDGATANDTAKLLVNPPAAGGEGGGNGDGAEGGLPITGAPVMLISGVGALLLAAGVAAYLISRRRRARFIA